MTVQYFPDLPDCPISRKELWRRFAAASEWSDRVKVPWHYSGILSQNDLRVLRALRRSMNWRTGWCWPSCATIASRLGLSLNTVKRSLAWLVKLGVVFRQRRWKTIPGQGRRQTSNAYRILPPSEWHGYDAKSPAPPPPPPDTRVGRVLKTLGRILSQRKHQMTDRPTAPTPPVLRPAMRTMEPLPSLRTRARTLAREGGTVEEVASLLESDPADWLGKRHAAEVRRQGLGFLLDL
jgi:DNA-binding transcriptional MocR family regulator